MNKEIPMWIFRIIASGILLQTLFFKFSGAEESIYIFSCLGIEPYGRFVTGIAELITAVLILIPRTTWMGALLGFGIMFGAIASHLLIIGIEVNNDAGFLFALAVVTLLSCIVLLYFILHKWFTLLIF